MTSKDQLTNYVGAFVDELTNAGVSHVVISPGSRSTPLAILMCDHENITSHILLDERSAAFFALGLAKASKKPVALVCTSGSAAANYYPAIVEASHSEVPLLILTSDRPHELRDVGAPQAMNQTELYRGFTKWFHEMALPENSLEMITYARKIAEKAVQFSVRKKGPVQINMPFREPLMPDLENKSRFTLGTRKRIQDFEPIISTNYVLSEELLEIWDSFQNVLVVAGDMQSLSDQKEVVRICKELSLPIVVDPLSQLRTKENETVIDSYDIFLREPSIHQKIAPDCVVRIGAFPVSKVLGQFLQKHDVEQWYVGLKDIAPDHIHTMTEHIVSSPTSFFEELAKKSRKKDATYLKKWLLLQETTSKILDEKPFSASHEGLLIREALKHYKQDAPIFVSNSMPIRDVDIALRSGYRNGNVYANRGVNGIDGVVSTALGTAYVHEEGLLITGDLTFYHDANGLFAAKKYHIPMKVLLINNDGGGIFSFLPQAKEERYFEELYGTPHGIDFRSIVKAYGGSYEQSNNLKDLQNFLRAPVDGLQVFEVQTNRKENYIEHQALAEEVTTKVRKLSL